MATVLPGDHDWVLDLLSPVPHRRAAALSRHRDLLQAATEARIRLNAIWAEAGTPVPREPRLAAARDQAQAAYDAARNSTLFGPVDQFLAFTCLTDRDHRDQHAPYAVLFLQWEQRYPKDWTEAGTWTGSHWGTKELLLRRFAEVGIPLDAQSDVARLIVRAVAGPYRCKDWRYAPLARMVDGAGFRHRITGLLNDPDPLPRLRARFLLDMLDHPEIRILRHTWHRWVAGPVA